MKRLLVFSLLLLTVGLTVSGAVKKTKLSVLYVGGHSNMETMFADADEEAVAKSKAERMASFEQFLNEYFTSVKVIDAKDYNYRLSYDYDVTVLDGQPTDKDKVFFPIDFDRPVLTIAELGKTVGGALGLKSDWYCLCLDRYAHSMRTSHPIFKGPYEVKMTLEDKPTPDEAKSYAPSIGEKLPETTPMWAVNTKGYRDTKGFLVGMVSRPWGVEDSPDAEWISSGLCLKCIDAMALGRHGSFFHWGFAGAPMDMTDEAKPLFANAIVYISKFAGQHVIARKLNEHIATRIAAKENAHSITRECWENYRQQLEKFNTQMKHRADSVKAAHAAGQAIAKRDEMYLKWKPQEIPTFEDFQKGMAGELYEKFGTDEQAYARYYQENTPYFYGGFKDYGLKLDEDAKSLGIANNDLRLLDRAISLWESGEDAAKGRRMLERYTLLRYDTPQAYRQWLNQYRDKLFFTESGGWLWLVNTQDKSVPGNDYDVLLNAGKPKERKPEISGTTSQANPVLVSAVTNDIGRNMKEMVIRIKMHPGFHIYGYVSDQDPYIATTFNFVTEGDYQTDGDLQLPPFTLLGNTGTTIYEGDVIFRQRIKGSGKGKVTCTVNYQTCNDHACLPPRDVVLTHELLK